MEKNRDELFKRLARTSYNCQAQILARLFGKLEMREYLNKPVDIEDLFSSIESLVEEEERKNLSDGRPKGR